MNICIGAQDGSVASLLLDTESDGLLALEAQFAQEMHIGTVRTMSMRKSTLLTSGVDETVKVCDLSVRRERGILSSHSCEVSAMTLFEDGRRHGHALTGDTSGSICLWRARDWHMLKTLRAHNSSVSAMGAHPSGMLALSASEDRSLLMWDLGRGKVVFSAKTKGVPVSQVCWTDDGQSYLLSSGCLVSLSCIDGKQVTHFPHDDPVAGVALQDADSQSCMLTAGEDGVVRLWDVRSAKVQREGPTHERRLVNVACDGDLVITTDVRGGLKVWDLRKDDEARLETNIGKAVSCMVAERAVDDRVENMEGRKRKAILSANGTSVESDGDKEDLDDGQDKQVMNANSSEKEPSSAASAAPKRKRRRKKSRKST